MSKDTISYRCPTCGANIGYDEATDACVCEYCCSSFAVSHLESLMEQDLAPVEEKYKEYEEKWKEIEDSSVEYRCEYCGATIVTEQNTSSTYCFYCHSPNLIKSKLTGKFRPNKIIIFKVLQEDVAGSLTKWVKKHWFVPRDYASADQLTKLTPLYVPYWLCSLKTNMELVGTGKKIKTWREGDYRVTKTDVYDIARTTTSNYVRIPHDASSELQDSIMRAISPYDYTEIRDFSMSYLAGHPANKYDVAFEEVFQTILDMSKATSIDLTEKETKKTYDVVTFKPPKVFDVLSKSYEYALLPVWFLSYKYKEKTYFYTMNGQTSKLCGTMPISKKRLGIFCAILFVVLLFVVYISSRIIANAVIGGVF